MILSFPPGTSQKTSDRVTEKVHTLLQSDFKNWGRIFPKGSPCEFTLDLKGMQYHYAKGAKEAKVDLRQVYYAKDFIRGSWQIASPLPLSTGTVRVHRKDGTSSVHQVGEPVQLLDGSNCLTDRYGQCTFLYTLGPQSTKPPQEVCMSIDYSDLLAELQKLKKKAAYEGLYEPITVQERSAPKPANFGNPGNSSSAWGYPPPAKCTASDSTFEQGISATMNEAIRSLAGHYQEIDATHKAQGYKGRFVLQGKDESLGIKITQEASSWADCVQKLSSARTDLRNIGFRGMDLQKVKFESPLQGSIFEGCDLRNASYKYGNLRDTTIKSCRLDGATFRGTVMDKSTKFQDLNLSDLDWSDISAIRDASLVNVSGIPKGMPRTVVLEQVKGGVTWVTEEDEQGVIQWEPAQERREHHRPPPGETGSVAPKKESLVWETHTKEVNMSKPNFKQMVLSDAEKAAYRITARNVVALGRDAILKILDSKGGEQAQAFSMMLSTEIGTSVVSGVMGGILTALPQFQNDTRVQKLAEELRVNGMATLGNTVVDQLTEIVAPAMSAMMSGTEAVAAQIQTPAESSVYKKPTLVQPEHHEEEDEEVASEALKSASLR